MRERAVHAPRLFAPKGLSRGAWAARFSLCVCLLAVIAALVPLSVECSPASFHVQKSKASAVQAYNANAYGFLAACAEAAGLSINDYMLTCGITLAGFTGYNIMAENVSYGADQTVNTVAKLVSTAEWPAWENLSETTKQSYGNNPDYYYAQQFNALAGSFGLGDARNVYYSSGGGDLDSGSTSICQRIGEIGNKYATGAIMSASDLVSVMRDSDYLYMRGGTNNGEFNNYGAILTKDKEINGVMFRFARSYPGIKGQSGYVFNQTNWFMYVENGFFYNRDWVYLFVGGTPINNLPAINISFYSNDDTRAHLGQSPYVGGMVWGGIRVDNGLSGTGQDSGVDCDYREDDSWLNELYAGGYLYNNLPVDLSNVNYTGVMPDTPNGTTNGDSTPEGIGSTELGPGTTYPEITGTPREPQDPPYVPPSPDERPLNPYNPSNPDNPANQSGTPEWKQETTENLQPALNIQFNKLFPFCMIYDLRLFWDRLKSIAGVESSGDLTSQARNRYEVITIPGIQFPGLEYGISFDLEPVATLCHYIRPAVFWLLIVIVVMSVIKFWQNILTGS